MLAHVDAENCEIAPATVQELGKDYLVNLDNTGRTTAKDCAFGIGGRNALFGKLIPPAFTPSNDLWMSGNLYFAPGFTLPLQPLYEGAPCNMGVHLWRLYTSLSSSKLSLDLNIPAGTSHLQLFVFQPGELPGHTVQNFVKDTNFQPTATGSRGRWHFWQLHIHLGHPGKSDGFVRIYVDGKFVDSLEKQPFLPVSADQSWWFRYADFQSNISGGSCNGSLWPAANEWLVDDALVCNRSCGTARSSGQGQLRKWTSD